MGVDEDDPRTPQDRRRFDLWRFGTPVVGVLSGALLVVSAVNSEGTDLRPGRYTDLSSLVQAEADEYDALRTRLEELNSEVEALTERVDDERVVRLQRQIGKVRDPAGMVPRSGPGVTVVLSDAPEERIEAAVNSTDPDVRLDDYVVHQQDIQAVVNAMWAGGAEAVTIEGQRVITTTGIKCEGNAVQLQGVPYPQPYEIQAVGNPASIEAALDSAPDVLGFRADAADPAIGLGWDLELEERVEAPAYQGLLDLDYAEPISRS